MKQYSASESNNNRIKEVPREIERKLLFTGSVVSHSLPSEIICITEQRRSYGLENVETDTMKKINRQEWSLYTARTKARRT